MIKQPAIIIALLSFLLPVVTNAQVYKHEFDTAPTSGNPTYNVAPTILDGNLSNSIWTNSLGDWTSFTRGTGRAIGLTDSSGNPVITLTFNVAPQKQLEITAFDFWRQRSNSGAQNWSLAINGTVVGNGSVPTSGAAIGNTPVSTAVAGLTGNVTVTLTLSGASGSGTFRLDDFTLFGTVTSTCTQPIISTFAPISGPANTQITVTGSGFNGASAVTLNGIPATYQVISDTTIKLTAPASATNGGIKITTNSCESDPSAPFTYLSAGCAPLTGLTELFISEVYDDDRGEGGVIEIYNPTVNTVDMSQYAIDHYIDWGNASPVSTNALSGMLPPGGIYLVKRLQGLLCNPSTIYTSTLNEGFNDNDKLDLLKNGVVIDRVRTPGNTGFSMNRISTALPIPNTTYTASQWNIDNNESCADVGFYSMPGTPQASIITQPQSTSTCAGNTAIFTVTTQGATGYTYQWKTLDSTGNWVNVTNDATYSGAQTATLTVNVVNALNGKQYYLEVTSATCTLISNAAQLTVNAGPNAPVGSNVVYCKNTTAAPLTATADSGNTLHWYTTANGGTELASAPTPDTSVTGSTNYYVSQKSAAGCESARTTINVTVNAPATQPTAFTLASEACVAGTNPQASLNSGTTTGGTFTSSDPARLVIDPVTGIINLASSTAGTYDVIYTVQADTANCLALSSSRNQIVIKALNPADVAFTYATVCETSANIFPVPASAATFTTGGTYTPSSGALIINPSTGEINVAASTPGDYTVTYSVTANSTSCTDAAVSAAIPVTIRQLSVPNTTYSYNPVCGLATTLTPQTDPGFVRGGTFSTTAAAGLLSINPVNGEIDLTTSTPGTYTVFYNLPQDNVNCIAAAINIPATVIITAPTVPVTQFNYSSTSVCSSTTANLTVQEFTGFTRGGTFGYTQGSGLAINTTTGSIDVANSTSGTYDVFYTVLPDVTNCIAGATSTPVRITIVPTTTPEVGFTYETNYCYGTGTVTPFTNPGFNATGTFTVTGGLSINATTGQLSLANATPGSYTVAYTVAADPSNCALGNTTSFTFNLAGEIEFAVDGVCEGPSFIISTTPVNNSFNDAAASYEWTTASGVTVGDNSENFNVSKYIQTINNPVYPMVFNVKVTVGNCTKTLPYTVDGITCQIQRGISPGGTAGLNDNFDLSGFGVKKISIFNRYGLEVYHKTNYTNEWHGQTDNGDELPTGTYFYMVKTATESKTGWIYINRP